MSDDLFASASVKSETSKDMKSATDEPQGQSPNERPHPITPCCFCGLFDYDYPDPTYLTVGTRSEVTKTWWCHIACFEERLPSLPEPWNVYDRDADAASSAP
jgi:hypothetical protein